MKCMTEHEAQKVATRQKIEAFETLRDDFITNLRPGVFLFHEKPRSKSVRDRYLRLEKRRRDAVRKSEKISGNKKNGK